MDEKIKYIMESNEIRNKLCKMGICPVVGPTGPKGDRGDIGPVGETGISHEIIIDETKWICGCVLRAVHNRNPVTPRLW